MIISNESMVFNDPKEFDDPRYSMIKRKFQLDFDNPKVYGNTSICDGPVALLPSPTSLFT